MSKYIEDDVMLRVGLYIEAHQEYFYSSRKHRLEYREECKHLIPQEVIEYIDKQNAMEDEFYEEAAILDKMGF